MEISFEEAQNLGLSDVEASLLCYLVNELGMEVEKSISIARNWAEDELQTPEKVRAGVLHERWLRENFRSDGTPINPEVE